MSSPSLRTGSPLHRLYNSKRYQLYKRGYVFHRGRLVVQIFQEQQARSLLRIPTALALIDQTHVFQVDSNTQDPIPAPEDTPWQVIVKTANPVRGTQEVPLGRHIEAVLEVQALMKGLLDLRRQDA